MEQLRLSLRHFAECTCFYFFNSSFLFFITVFSITVGVCKGVSSDYEDLFVLEILHEWMSQKGRGTQ